MTGYVREDPEEAPMPVEQYGGGGVAWRDIPDDVDGAYWVQYLSEGNAQWHCADCHEGRDGPAWGMSVGLARLAFWWHARRCSARTAIFAWATMKDGTERGLTSRQWHTFDRTDLLVAEFEGEIE